MRRTRRGYLLPDCLLEQRPKMARSVFILAAESSGDQLGAGLITALTRRDPNLDISGIGGTAMRDKINLHPFDISKLSVLGFVEAAKIYPSIPKLVNRAVSIIMQAAPDAAILVDSWGFMIRVANGLKRAGYQGQIIKYVAPQVWAMREGRARILAENVDHLLTIHSFDAPYFTRHGLSVDYVGNPVFDDDYDKGDAQSLRARLSIGGSQPICALMLGSRRAEIKSLAGPIGNAAQRLTQAYPNIAFVSPISDNLQGSPELDFLGRGGVHLLGEADKFDVFAAADIAIAASGTVTSQLACAGVPTLVAYKLHPLTWMAAKRLYKADYVSLVNLTAGEALMPEFLQDAANGKALFEAAKILLDDRKKRSEISKRLLEVTQTMRGGGKPASERAAEAVLGRLS